MKVLIAGSRSIGEYDLSLVVPSDVELIISGGASGIDALAEKFADAHKISKLILRPNYKKYKRAAPLKRNEIMIDFADMVIVIWDGVSKGSLYTIEYAKKKNKSLKVITI